MLSMNTKKWLALVVVVLIVLAAGGAYWYYRTFSVPLFPLNSADAISSWNFKGAYTGNDTLAQQATADLAKLAGLLGKGEYDDYDLYIGIGNDNDLLGNGKAAYVAYSHAIKLFPNQALAYTDLGHLMDEIGALNTAADAYAAGVHAEPGVLDASLERLNFLTTRLSSDTDAIQAALKDANQQFGDNASVLSIEAQWLESQKRYADAIAEWQTAEKLSPPSRAAAIEAQIARDRAKE